MTSRRLVGRAKLPLSRNLRQAREERLGGSLALPASETPSSHSNATAFLVAAILIFSNSHLLAAPPALSNIYPAGGQRGTRVVVKCSGKFSWPVSVWAPGVEVEPEQESGKLKIAIPPDLAADRVWIRLYNSEGASAALPFLIGGLPEIDEKEPNNSLPTSLALLPSGWTINGVLDGVDVDGFAIPLTAGENLVAVLDAHDALGSPMDAMLQVISPDGVVVAENNDDIDLDPLLTYTASKTGTYVVRLFAFSSTPNTGISLRGGKDFIYRLTLTTGPYVRHAVPLAVSGHEPGQVELRGWNVPPDLQVPVVPFGTGSIANVQEFDPVADLRSSPDVRLGFAFAPNLAGSARVRLTPYFTVPGVVASDEKNPLSLSLPTSATGWLRSPKQNDRFRITLKKGDPLIVSVEARSLGFPFDPFMRLLDPTGAVAAEFDDIAPARASVLVHTAAHDGDYQLAITDRTRLGGDRCYYRLTARLEEPDFELSAAADNIVVAPDKPTEFSVTILRRASPGSAVGPISIEAVDLPPGISAPAITSEPAGATAGKVTLVFSSNGSPFSGPIRIVGRTGQPSEMTRFARTPVNFGNCLEVYWLTGVARK